MKKLSILIVGIGLISCSQNKNVKENPNNIPHDLEIVTLEGCQYYHASYSNGVILEHKGNCNNPIHKNK